MASPIGQQDLLRLYVSSLETCAKKGGLRVNKDEDGKYVEILNIPFGRHGEKDVGYYFINDSSAISSLTLAVSDSLLKAEFVGRTALEADVAGAMEAMAKQWTRVIKLTGSMHFGSHFWAIQLAKDRAGWISMLTE